ncbi:MAG: hypothetical protein AB7S77_14965 [Desulfatirhabdiaceae bacterium]
MLNQKQSRVALVIVGALLLLPAVIRDTFFLRILTEAGAIPFSGKI